MRPLSFATSPRYVARWVVLRLTLLATLLLVAANVFISERSLDALTRHVQPEFNREAAVVGGSLASQVQRAVTLGIPLDQLVGMDTFLNSVLLSRPSFVYLALTDAQGRTLYESGKRREAFDAAVAERHLRFDAMAEAALFDRDTREQVTALGALSNTAIPIIVGNSVAGWLNVGVDTPSLERLTSDTRWDVFILLLVGGLVAFEVFNFLVARSLATPLRLVRLLSSDVTTGNWAVRGDLPPPGEAARLLGGVNAILRRINDHWDRLHWKASEVERANPRLARRLAAILAAAGRGGHFDSREQGRGPALRRNPASSAIPRLALFILIFADQLATSFMPLYGAQLTPGPASLDRGLALSLPIVVFIATVVLMIPMGGWAARRWGLRRLLMAGLPPAILGYAMSAFADTLAGLVLWRAVTGIGYALSTVACQGQLAAADAEDGTRGRSVSVFITAVATGTASGTAIGSVLADRMGFAPVFLVAACLVAVVAVLIGVCRKEIPVQAEPASYSFRRTLSHRDFAALLLLVVVPGRLALSGLVFYLAPLYLAHLHVSQPEIGRIIMSSAIGMLLVIALSSANASRAAIPQPSAIRWQLVLAGLIAGIGTLAALILPAIVALFVTILVFGLCQGVTARALLAVLPGLGAELDGHKGANAAGGVAIFGHLRMGERFGAVLGPLVAALLANVIGYRDATLWLGSCVALGALGFALLWRKPTLGGPEA